MIKDMKKYLEIIDSSYNFGNIFLHFFALSEAYIEISLIL